MAGLIVWSYLDVASTEPDSKLGTYHSSLEPNKSFSCQSDNQTRTRSWNVVVPWKAVNYSKSESPFGLKIRDTYAIVMSPRGGSL